MQFDSPAERIMVALDFDDLAQAEEVVLDLAGIPVTFKVGNQLGTYEGWAAVIEMIHQTGGKVFCDTKFKDIPATVEKSSRAITRHQPDFFNIMSDNSQEALRGAVRGVESAIVDYGLAVEPILLGVTVLTSIDDEESEYIYGAPSEEKVVQFALASAENGLDGVVCSAQEAEVLRANEDTQNLILVTPGIRPSWALAGDQARILTPRQAVDAGADYLVIGRPITQPPKDIGGPRDAVMKIIEELS